jgi:hypothetical protein
MRARHRWLVLLAAMGAPGALPAQSLPRPTVREIATPGLPDAAVAVADAHRPVIYYNPRTLAESGPDLAAFLMEHERGHIAHGHRRPAPGAMSATAAQALLRRYEYEADCWAAVTLAVSHQAAVSAAIQYFRNVGALRADLEHPSGTERAAGITACLEGSAPSNASGGQ